MKKEEIIDDYFNWLCSLVTRGRRFGMTYISYSKLLSYLHSVEFRYPMPMDANREADGVTLRWRFACDTGREDLYGDISQCLAGPCSMLEMMIGLAIRCEETIMDNPCIGNRTGQWFWGMITNLGLGGMPNDRFDEHTADEIVQRFINREYAPDGTGGLFTVRGCKHDLRNVEIWYQLCWYLDSIS